MQSSFDQQISAAGLVPGDKLLVAVSGGIDSVVLLHLLHSVAAARRLQLSVAHLDHRIRPESVADADFVRRLCVDWGIPCVVESRDIPQLAVAQKISLEMAGRQARREFLLRQADQVGARLIALAHHRDDQVETFLLRLLRGSGVAGLAAMRPLRDCWWRPLLECSRDEILNYARQQQLEWVEDVSNVDTIYLRNRLRHQLLPQLRDVNPQLDRRLAELCRQLQVDDDYWRRQVAEILPSVTLASEDGLRLDRRSLLALPEALRVRVLREALRQVRGDIQRLEAVHLHAVTDLLSSERSQAQLDLPACWVARRYEQLWLRRRAAKRLPAYDLPLSVPGELQLPCGRSLRAQLRDEVTGESTWVAEFSLAGLKEPLRVRNWRAGDRFEPQGLAGSKRLKRLFSDQQIELEERLRVPLLVSGETILWVVGLRRSRRAPVVAKPGEILHLALR
ncbi:MAG: tRNA lysidine(34) synthetase TilS [Deltaproteobacteria bacterium]|nr:tRNA lysidine(34) synthetase TilS [Deltaproteobacteria bacterium]